MRKLSNYQVEDTPLGEGGMGRVLRGTDTTNGREVAIKEILPEYATDFEIRTRTEREVEILQILNSIDGVVKVYDRFPLNNNFYIVMELIDGMNLEQYVKKYNAIPFERATKYMIKILGIMQSVHEHKVVHRDMKPSNIMIRSNMDDVCILDFGIAKDMDNVTGHQTTIVGSILGSDGYMSPEQADGFSIDHRADIYALGCVFYYMLTAHHAYSKLGSDFETQSAIVNKPFPRLKDNSRASFPPRLQQILDRATDKNMMKRYQSCREFRKDLQELISPKQGGGATHVSKEKSAQEVTITVGREDCDIIIDDLRMKVSRSHLDINFRQTTSGDFYVITDHSSNGTLINGQLYKRNTPKFSVSIPANGPAPQVYLAADPDYALNWEEVRRLVDKRLGREEDKGGEGSDVSGATIYGTIPVLPSSNVSFIDAVKLFFTRYVDFKGRSRRREYWWMFLFHILVGIVLTLLTIAFNWSEEDVNVAITLYYGVVAIPSLALSIRRLHDIGYSWYYMLASFVPIIGGFILLYWMLQDSEPIENDWGPCPK